MVIETSKPIAEVERVRGLRWAEEQLPSTSSAGGR